MLCENICLAYARVRDPVAECRDVLKEGSASAKELGRNTSRCQFAVIDREENDNLIEVIINHYNRSPSPPKLHVIHLQSVGDHQVVDLVQQAILVKAGLIHA